MRNLKKSEAYHIAQLAVLNYDVMSSERKLEVIAMLMREEETQRILEQLNEEQEKGDSIELSVL